MRKYASGGNYKYKELYERAWKEEDKRRTSSLKNL